MEVFLLKIRARLCLATTKGGHGQSTRKWQLVAGRQGPAQHLLRAQVHDVHAGAQAPELVGSQAHHGAELLSEARHRLDGVALDGHPLPESL